MKVKRHIFFLLFSLFSAGVIYSQDIKRNTPPASSVSFGKFVLDSIYNVKVNEVIFADSLFVKDGAARIASFDVYTKVNKVGITESAYGNKLSKKQRLLISQARPGQMIYFQKIMVKYPGKDKIKINSRFIFKIKN